VLFALVANVPLGSPNAFEPINNVEPVVRRNLRLERFPEPPDDFGLESSDWGISTILGLCGVLLVSFCAVVSSPVFVGMSSYSDVGARAREDRKEDLGMSSG
jgi:hypothetical protein